ncbi:hypothetical protein D3C80_1086480 [compost metagenome]
MHRARILCLVNENMVDALIELVMHPCTRRIAVEQIGGALDQILEIELAALLFQILEITDQPFGQNKGAFGRGQHPHQTVTVAAGNHMVARQRQCVDKIRSGFLHALVDDIGIRFLFALGRQQCGLDEFHPPHRVRLPFRFPEGVSDIDDTRSADLVCKCQIGIECEPGEAGQGPEGRRCRFFGLSICDLHRLPQPGINAARLFGVEQKAAKGAAIGDDGGEQRFQPTFVGEIEHIGQRLGQFRIALRRNRRQKRTACFSQEGGCGPVIEYGKMTGDIGLQWKLMQQRLAESVDGLDFQAAGRFQRLGEQPARFRKLDAIWRSSFNGGDTVLKIGIRQSSPFRQAVEDTARHFRCGSLGIGEAEDRGGTASGQKQADDTLGQHMGLA